MKKIYIFIIIIFLNILIQPLKSDEKYDLGRDIFLNKANCAACHTLKAANSVGQIGPNLDQINLSNVGKLEPAWIFRSKDGKNFYLGYIRRK